MEDHIQAWMDHALNTRDRGLLRWAFFYRTSRAAKDATGRPPESIFAVSPHADRLAK